MEASSATSMIHVTEDVINKVRDDLVYNGELDESVLSQLQASWERKMIQAGIISGTMERSGHASVSTPTLLNLLPSKVESGTEIDAQFPKSNHYPDIAISMKREHDGFYIPQQDGATNGGFVTEPKTEEILCENEELYENEEILNEDDDDDDDVIDEDDMNNPHLVMCQFDTVKRLKNRWDCKFKAGIMEINGKNILFSNAKGDFNF